MLLLLQEGGGEMANVSHVIVDEAHERSEVSTVRLRARVRIRVRAKSVE